MLASDPYELIDFGRGRRLERFGRWVLDRPAPSARGAARLPANAWADADACYQGARSSAGHWRRKEAMPRAWSIAFDRFWLELRLTESGQVGLFPEQADNWSWIARRARAAAPLSILNLFAYTGAATLAALGTKNHVVHVDASRSAVHWARRNAELSKMENRSVRWITDDARKFVKRQCRRGSRYDGIILDPPSYGHGPRGATWKLETDLPPLLDDCRALLNGPRSFLLLTCHTSGITAGDLARLVQDSLGTGTMEPGQMSIACHDGRRLEAGVFVRWTPEGST